MPNENENLTSTPSNAVAVDVAASSPRTDRLATLEERLKEMNSVLTAVVVILLVMVVGLFITYIHERAVAYNTLLERVIRLEVTKDLNEPSQKLMTPSQIQTSTTTTQEIKKP